MSSRSSCYLYYFTVQLPRICEALRKASEMVGWYHQLDRHEFEQAPGVGDRQGSLACCSPWGRRVRRD